MTVASNQMNKYEHLGLPEGHVLVVGLGKTGVSVARFLARNGIEFSVTDSRAEPPGLSDLKQEFPNAPIYCGEFLPEVFQHAAVLIVSPGVSVKEPVIVALSKRNVPVLGDVELFARVANAPVIGITGSNGKSTVTTLVGEMAKAAGMRVAVGGNLGTPALDLVDEAETELYVLELSSFQLETTTNLHLAASVILNISEDHMDRYDTLDEYIQAKTKIYAHSDAIVVNTDDEYVKAQNNLIPQGCRVTSFTLNESVEGGFGLSEIGGTNWLCYGKERLIPVHEVRIQGRHNTANALAALALGMAVRIPMQTMLETLRSFPGLPHRMQWVTEFNGVTWFNDSKATNVGAALAAINGVLAQKIILIAGGQGKGQDFSPLLEPLKQRARLVILLGIDAPKIENILKGYVPYENVKDMREAIQLAKTKGRSGDAVLLSPACASFDMFSGYAHRGEVFTQLTQEIVQ